MRRNVTHQGILQHAPHGDRTVNESTNITAPVTTKATDSGSL